MAGSGPSVSTAMWRFLPYPFAGVIAAFATLR
jgi:hypothetical protein